jgi:OOP family OmpA-OmpF porin
MRSQVVVAACLAAAAIPSVAYSQAAAPGEQERAWPSRGAYAGASIGKSKFHIEESAARINGATSTRLSKDESDTAYKVYGGYRFNEYFAVEGGFTEFGTFSATRTMTAPGTGTFTIKSRIGGLHGEAVGMVPFGRFAVFGKLGLVYTITESTASSSGSVVVVGTRDQTSSDVNVKAGIGASFDITRHFGVRVEAEQVFDAGDQNIGKGDIRVLSAGAYVRF